MKVVRLLLLLLGVGLTAYLVHLHSGTVLAAFSRVGWGFLPFLAASLLIYVLDALGWWFAFPGGKAPVPFRLLFNARMAGEAVNKVTPLASLGGEPVKAYLLQRVGIAVGEAYTSVIVSKGTLTFSLVLFIFGAVAMGWERLPASRGVLLGFALFPALILAVMLVSAVLAYRMRDTLDTLTGEGARGNATTRSLVGLFGRSAAFVWTFPRAALLSFLFFLLGWAAGALELLAGAYALGIRLSPQDALLMEGLLVSINMATFLIPANAGTQEGGFAYLAPLLGLSPGEGVALGLLRRCRDVLWILYGLGYLSLTEGKLLLVPPAMELPKEGA